LLHWTKRGYAFAQDLRWDSHRWSKSGGIVTSLQDGRLRAVRINSHYWMYWGEFGVNLAWSDNLLDWHPVPGVDGQDLILPPRPGLFDSALAEGGPPPILTDRGIVVLYNGKNDAHDRTGDPTLPAGIYSGGQALFSANEPGRLLERTTRPFFRPAESWEKTGQYTDGTTFIEGLVQGRDLQVLRSGGASRADSVRQGLQAWRQQPGGPGPDDWVLVHDAARCLIEPEQVRSLIERCRDDAVGGLLALPLPDTLKSERDGRVSQTLERAGKWLAQTPQMFRLGALEQALHLAQAQGLTVTDDASAIEAQGLATLLVAGSAQNFKVTYPQDFRLAQAVLSSRQTPAQDANV
jgi:2-C-methyl-D-erythritol 4-phosphate cytidylyltransferase